LDLYQQASGFAGDKKPRSVVMQGKRIRKNADPGTTAVGRD
jgi:hypothetical protein